MGTGSTPMKSILKEADKALNAESQPETPKTTKTVPSTIDRESARREARVKAQAKADHDLGLSPPDYIDNLKDKLRKKNSADAEESARTRTRSFSEPQSNQQLNLVTPIAILPHYEANPSAHQVAAAKLDALISVPVSVPLDYVSSMKSAKSVPQMMTMTPLLPASPQVSY